MLKFIPIYFELTLGLFNTNQQIRNKHIVSLNNIMDKKIILGLEDYTTYNFWIKEIFKTNSKLITPFVKIVELINIDPNMILNKVSLEKSPIIIPKQQPNELVIIDRWQKLLNPIPKEMPKKPIKESYESYTKTLKQLGEIESIVDTSITKKLDNILKDTKEIKTIKQESYDYNELELYTVSALKKKCVEYGLPQSGLKQDIIKRLIVYNKSSKDNKCSRCLDNHRELSPKINCIHKDICIYCASVLKVCPKCLKKYN
jgi:hypothetical protein